MPRKPQVLVQPRADGRWAVQTDGARRADSVHNRKSDAVSRGRQLAEKQQTELVIKQQSGRVIDRDSYGRDFSRGSDSSKLHKGAASFTSKKSAEVIESKARVFEAVLKRLAKR